MSAYDPDGDRAKLLAVQLKEMMEKYFLGPHSNEGDAEISALQAEIEKLGFLVIREPRVLRINRHTGELTVTADVTLFRLTKTPTSH
jgi:hypothetical protein